MITPNRYHLWAALECHAFSKAEAVLRFSAEEDGMWVQWQDYARLKAEVERLKMEESKLLTLCETYEGDLERLRKAGDAICAAYELGDDFLSPIQAWNAAKEGKQP